MELFAKYWLLLLIAFYPHFFYGQMCFEVSGLYKGLTAQGMAVSGSRAFLLNNTGMCRIYDLKKKKVLTEFPLMSSGKNNHANCASFGRERIKGGEFPVLYISELVEPCRCFVESVSDKGAVLVQTISLDRKGIDSFVHDWIVDKKRKRLYSVFRCPPNNSNEKQILHRINCYRLPRLREGKHVVLSEKDVLDSFDILFPNMLQGGIIKGDYLYLPTGLCDTSEVRADKERSLIIVNLKSHKIEQKIDLTNLTKDEPEDCDFYKNKLLLFCGQSGGLYEIPLK